jgi:hypothetical protein
MYPFGVERRLERMRLLRQALVVALAASLAFVPVSSRAAGDDGRSRAMGSGEMVLSTHSEYMGNTLTFDVSSLPHGDNVRGEIFYNELGPSGTGLGRWKGNPDCFRVSGTTAYVAGDVIAQDGSTASGRFWLKVSDDALRDEVSPDVIQLAFGPEVVSDCVGFNDPDLDDLELARGATTVQGSSD